jgi:hypothetical protein
MSTAVQTAVSASSFNIKNLHFPQAIQRAYKDRVAPQEGCYLDFLWVSILFGKSRPRARSHEHAFA